MNYIEIKDSERYKSLSFDEWFMKHVYLTSEKSRDPRTKIGAVLVKDKHIISSGFNGFPMGIDDLIERYDDRETKYKYVVHAEQNSILVAARFGISIMDTTLYTNGIPCHSCMKSVIQGGIKDIVIHKQWPEMVHSEWIESIKISKIMMREAGINLKIFDKKLNISAFLDGKQILV